MLINKLISYEIPSLVHKIFNIRLVQFAWFAWYNTLGSPGTIRLVNLVAHRPSSNTYLLTWRTGFDYFVKYNHVKFLKILDVPKY
ncbi:hypothetical protein BpHYR1_018615 [Brachionus plicatilis]|uniref:Uncharacterized protein n=1 Tax=Brachionus plicatilis TaxID=10195 RepID=A0A3M7SJB3_BRAPC|nr:hypothetical protein BpHYR1_018615 [Brachionus plicatilis]